jgi:LMBR1 domain-containing protein 1
MLVTNIDKFFNSRCGFTCGYMLDTNTVYFNPLDWLLQTLSFHHTHNGSVNEQSDRFYSIQLFLDTILFAIILIYTFICILYGIIKIGINFFSLEIYRIKRRDTMP